MVPNLEGPRRSGGHQLSSYNRDQGEALGLVRRQLAALAPEETTRLRQAVRPYLEYREAVAAFQREHLAAFCGGRCFSRQACDCCGREGIITFFADVVVNALLSTEAQLDALHAALAEDGDGEDCVYVRPSGCLWRLKPIVCEMFLCDHAKGAVLEPVPVLAGEWERLRQAEADFTRPTKPVLFDDLERLFIDAGFDSPLMYFHRSPGLLRLKAKHGVGIVPERG